MNEESFEKLHTARHEFLNGGSRFNLEASSWKHKKLVLDARHSFLTTPNQKYAILRRTIFTIGPSHTSQEVASLYSYNLTTEHEKEWPVDADTNVPSYKQGYGLIEANGRICIFGGRKGDRYSNELFSFCSYSNEWLPIIDSDSSTKPSPRQPFIFSTLGPNILVVGGTNAQTIFKDAFIVVDGKWVELAFDSSETADFLLGLEGTSYCSVDDKLWVFGGRRKEDGQYSNDLFCLSLQEDKRTLKIQKVGDCEKNRPTARAFHKMCRLGDNCLAVIGGAREGSKYRGISVLNIKKKEWFEVNPLNGPIPHLSEFHALFDGHSIYLLAEKNGPSEKPAILELCFSEFEMVKSEICANCIKRLENKEREDLHNPKKPFVSNGLIYNMAIQISFPFQAIQLLIDCAATLHATHFSIKSSETKSKMSYLDIRFDGLPLTREQFASIISHSYKNDPVSLALIDKVKLGCLRLGKTFILVSVDGSKRRVFLFSADSLIISHYDEIYEYFAYEERTTDDYVYTQEGIMHKKFILNQLASFVERPKELLESIESYGLIIFDNNVIMTSEKTYYSEMISTPDNMQLCKNSKKVEFLNKVGFRLGEDPEVSLSAFLSVCYLTNGIQSVSIHGRKYTLQDNKYEDEINKMVQASKIKELYVGEMRVKNVVASCKIYEVITEEYLPEAKGVLVYFQGRLVNRMDISFGDLFWQKFYRTKYKKPFNLWQTVGLVNILEGVELKTSQTGWRPSGSFGMFERQLKKKMQNWRRAEEVIEIDEEAKSSKGEKKQKVG